MKEKIQDITNLIDSLKNCRDVIEHSIEEIEPYAERLVNYIVDTKANAVKRLVNEHGFTKQEAISMSNEIHTQIMKNIKDLQRDML